MIFKSLYTLMSTWKCTESGCQCVGCTCLNVALTPPRIQKINLLAGCQVASIASSGVVIFTNLGPFGFTFCAFPMAEPSVFWESHVSLTCLWARSGAARVPC